MMTVRRYSRGPGATPIGKPALHPATIDLKGKAYEYVSLSCSQFFFSEAFFPFLSFPFLLVLLGTHPNNYPSKFLCFLWTTLLGFEAGTSPTGGRMLQMGCTFF